MWICLRRLLLDGLELILNEVVKKHIPTKQRCVKKTKQPAWIDENIMSAIKKCDRELLVKQTALMMVKIQTQEVLCDKFGEKI